MESLAACHSAHKREKEYNQINSYTSISAKPEQCSHAKRKSTHDGMQHCHLMSPTIMAVKVSGTEDTIPSPNNSASTLMVLKILGRFHPGTFCLLVQLPLYILSHWGSTLLSWASTSKRQGKAKRKPEKGFREGSNVVFFLNLGNLISLGNCSFKWVHGSIPLWHHWPPALYLPLSCIPASNIAALGEVYSTHHNYIHALAHTRTQTQEVKSHRCFVKNIEAMT